MPTTVPAMKARFGNTDYYILSMKAQELVNKVTIPKDLPGWAELTVNERYQREINDSRVKTQIAPYLANDESRFFGAVILAVINFEDSIEFEPLTDIQKMHKLYAKAAKDIGFLTFSGEEILVPLDGQHRLRAIQYAISGMDSKNQPIKGIESCGELAKDDVTVILVAFDSKKSRKMFTRVNRYAKATTTSLNYITDDDDVIAVLARKIADETFTGRLVNIHSNTLSLSGPEITTLSNIYNCNDFIIEAWHPGQVNKSQPPEKNSFRLYRDKVEEIWGTIIEHIDILSDALYDKTEAGDPKRQEIKSTSLLGKPAAQECLIRAYVALIRGTSGVREEEACVRLNQIKWVISEENVVEIWNELLWSGSAANGKMITKRRKLAARVITYMAHGLTEEEEQQLLRDYLALFNQDERQGKLLPPKIQL